jgi:hypothetical protein
MSEPITNEMTGVQPSSRIESITPTGPAIPVFEMNHDCNNKLL